MFEFVCKILGFSLKITCFLSFPSKSHAESPRNFIHNLVVDPKRAKFNQKSEIGHVRTCQDLSRKTHKGPKGPIWAHEDRSWQVRTCPISDFWLNFACFGPKNGIFTKFIDDYASFLLEKFKNHVILIKNLNI